MDPKKEHSSISRGLLEKHGFSLADDHLCPVTVPKGTTWYGVTADGITGYGASWQDAYDHWFRAAQSARG
jgi:hypothetical protein